MKFFKPNFWDKNKISFFSILLYPISQIIRLIFFLKIFLIKKENFKIPIICVGNIYLGGTGKTPLCTEIFSILKKLNKNPAFIKKEYKFTKDETAMEREIGPVYENTKRVYALNEAMQNNIDVAVLDDGFQDFSIKKDLSIVCFNERQWIGNGFTIPSGPLRESVYSLNRAHIVMINGKKNKNIEKKLLDINKYLKIFYSEYLPINISKFKNKKIICFAGIGNPSNFFNLLNENEINVFEKVSFPDHYKYTDRELKNLIIKAKESNSTLLTTEKDYLRISKYYRKNIDYLKIKVEINNKIGFVEEIKKII
jgi:tetraacyldisaccharide 4'-kinase